MSKINLLDFSRNDLEKFMLDLGEKPFRSAQLVQWIHQLGVSDFSNMTNLRATFREYLKTHCTIASPVITHEQIARDNTRKWLLTLADNNLIETVFIPEETRGTLCISSQVGCKLGCGFCATGKIPFRRNLSVAEIIGQLWLAVRKLSRDQTTRTGTITNVVFMGMGEPLLNYDAVIKASELMLDDYAYGLSKYKVTISTSGIVPELHRLRTQSNVALAISLHAPTDELRSKLMPINKQYQLCDLITVCNNYFQDQRRQVTIEYIMLKDINDQPLHARQLVKLLSHGRYKVNLIPANPLANSSWCSSPIASIETFRNILLSAGINTITRKSRGQEIAAGCGQLAGKSHTIN